MEPAPATAPELSQKIREVLARGAGFTYSERFDWNYGTATMDLDVAASRARATGNPAGLADESVRCLYGIMQRMNQVRDTFDNHASTLDVMLAYTDKANRLFSEHADV